MARDIHPNELVALKEIAEILNTTNDMDQMLNDGLAKLLEATGFTTGWIFLIDRCTGSVCAASHNLPPAMQAQEQALMCGNDCWCVEKYFQGKLNHAVNIIECSRITYAVEFKLGDTNGLSHHATVPLKAGLDQYGLLNVADVGKAHFSDDELALLQAVAIQIGTAIKRIRLYQKQELNAKLYAKLGDFIQRINAIQDIHRLPLQAVKAVGEMFHWPNVSLFIYEQEELSLRVRYTDGQAEKEWQSLPVDQAGPIGMAFKDNRLTLVSRHRLPPESDLLALGIPPYMSAAAIPLRSRSRTIGVLLISSPSPRQFDDYNEDFMYSLGDHLTLCIENLRLYEQRSELARMEERNRVARDLHDSVIQKVFSLSFLAKGAETLLEGSAKEALVHRSLQEIRQLSAETLKEMRSLIWQLHPAGLENGLLSALRHYGEGMNLTIYEQVEGVKSLPRAVEEAFWRIGQEALNNVRKHADTNEAFIKLVVKETGASLEIRDNGKGFSSEKQKGKLTMGMMSMRERAEMLGGKLTVTSGLGKPTTVTVSIPVEVVKEICSEERERR